MRWVVALLAAALALSAGHRANAQTAKVVTACGLETYTAQFGQQQPMEIDVTGKLCIAGSFSGTFNSTANAVAALPSLAPGSVTPQASLAGAYYMQPVFSSASGGGTQVDATHGLPVNIIAGSSSGSLTDITAFTQGTTQFVPSGGYFTSSVTNLTTGQAGALRLTADRMAMDDVEKIGGTTIVTGGVAGLVAVGGPVASAGTNADNPVKVGGVFNTTQPTVTTGQIVDLQATARGALIVGTGADTFNVTVNAALAAGSNTIGGVTQTTSPWVDNVSQWNGNNIDTNSGNKSGGTLRMVLATDQPNLATPLNVQSNGVNLATATGQTGVQVAVGGAAAPTNAEVAGGVFNTVLPTLSNGQAAALQLDSSAQLLISPSNLTIAQASTTAGQTGSLVMMAVTTSAPTDTTAKSYPLSGDTSGNLRVNCVTGCGSSSFADEGAFTQGSTAVNVMAGLFSNSITNLTTGQAGAWQFTNDRMGYVNIGKYAGTAPDTNTGNATAGTPRFVLASNQPIVAVQPQPGTANGCTPYHLAGGSAASTNSTSVKGSAGNLCDLVVVNTTSTIYYLKLYDSAAAPTCSSATGIKHVYPIPNNTGTGGGIVRSLALGESYASGIGYCLTGGGGDTDNTNAATGVFIEASYK